MVFHHNTAPDLHLMVCMLLSLTHPRSPPPPPPYHSIDYQIDRDQQRRMVFQQGDGEGPQWRPVLVLVLVAGNDTCLTNYIIMRALHQAWFPVEGLGTRLAQLIFNVFCRLYTSFVFSCILRWSIYKDICQEDKIAKERPCLCASAIFCSILNTLFLLPTLLRV